MAPSGQVLDELTELAAVEHAVIAEYLQIAYVLVIVCRIRRPGRRDPRSPTRPEDLEHGAVVEMKHLKLSTSSWWLPVVRRSSAKLSGSTTALGRAR